MPTPNLGLPLITGNMTANVPRDMNALAEAVDNAFGNLDELATKSEVSEVSNALTMHLNAELPHKFKNEKDSNAIYRWGFGVDNIGPYFGIEKVV